MRRRLLALILALLGGAAPAFAQTVAITIPPGTLMPPVIVFPASAVNGAGVIGATLLFSPDNTFNIGAVGATRPSNITFGNQINGPVFALASGNTAKFAWGSGNAWASNATPTISSGFGTSPAIAGTASVYRVTLGNPVAQSGVVLFNASPAFGSAPFVSCRDETTQTANPPTYTVTATQVTITFTIAVASDAIVCAVLGLP
jgi:hypothetical protein